MGRAKPHLRPTIPRTLHRSGNGAAPLLLAARRLARRLPQHVTLLRVDTSQGSGLTGQRRSAHGTALPGFALGKGTRVRWRSAVRAGAAWVWVQMCGVRGTARAYAGEVRGRTSPAKC